MVITVPLPVKPRVLNARLPLPGAGDAVNAVAFWVTASSTLCWPRSAMVSAVITSTLAGVCSRLRLSRLPLDAGPVRLSVGAADASGDGTGAAAVATAARCRRDRADDAARLSPPRRLVAAGVAGLVTTTGSRSRLTGAPCVQASTGQKVQSAKQYSKDVRRDARSGTEVIKWTRGSSGPSPRTKSSPRP